MHTMCATAILSHVCSLQPYLALMRACTSAFMTKLRDAAAGGRREVEMLHTWGELTMEVVVRCAYG